MGRFQPWAKSNFDRRELQEILDICVNFALLVPRDTPWPGTYHGDEILFRKMYERPSIFNAAVSANPDFRVRLNNGRFWEMIPEMVTFLDGGYAYKVVADVLLNHYSDLDEDFAPKGFKIFYRAMGDKQQLRTLINLFTDTTFCHCSSIGHYL